LIEANIAKGENSLYAMIQYKNPYQLCIGFNGRRSIFTDSKFQLQYINPAAKELLNLLEMAMVEPFFSKRCQKK
jgi:hypothetical protein